MGKSVLVSIKPKYKELLFSKEKVYEYRNVIPKNKIKYMYVYETSPIQQLGYILELDSPIVFPNKINEGSYGTDRFNDGTMKCKIAYPIKHIYILDPIKLSVLKSSFNFIIPQSFIYLESIPLLNTYLKSLKTTKIW